MQRGVRGAVLFGVFLLLPLFVRAQVSPQSIGYYCAPDSQTIVDGQYYAPQSDPCVYQSASLSYGGRYGDVYRGTVGSSTIITGHSLGFSADSMQFSDVPAMQQKGIAQGEDVFVAIYRLLNPFTNVELFRNYFQHGGTPPHNDYGFVRFKYGVEPHGCVTDCFSNVLFLPGIESSRLYRPDYQGGTDKLWEPNNNDDVRDLYLSDTGTSIRSDIYTREGDVLDEISLTGANIYKSFIATMDQLVADGKINAWEAAPYDWRLSLDDVVNYGASIDGRLYYSGDLAPTSTPYIIQELRHLAKTSKSGKVTIIAHSNGGLVAKKLTEALGAEAGDLIDTMIFVAVPQEGTPMAIAAALHGYKQDHGPFGLITSEATARTFASTSPAAYNLLPSVSYFGHVSDPVITFDPSLTDWITRYGSSITSASALSQFLTDTFGRVDPGGDINQPIQLHQNLLTDVSAEHASLDAWSPPAGINLVQIAGWGVPTTVAGIEYKKKGTGVQPEMKFTIDGDGTVVVPSALETSAARYWVDLQKYNKRFQNQLAFGLLSVGHSNILELPEFIDFIADELTKTVKPLNNYSYISDLSPIETENRLRYSLHSPLTFDLYDDQHRHTGISTSTNQVEEQIPGTYFTQFGDTKYIFADASDVAHLVMNGYANGTFTLDVDEFNGDSLVATTTWQDMPTTPQTKVSLDVQSDIMTVSPLRIDANGDGTPELNLAPKLNDIVLPPKAPITVTANDKSIILGSTLPPLTTTYSGFINGDTANSNDITGAPHCSTSANVNTAGTSSIVCTVGTLTSQTYDFAKFIPGVLSVLYQWSGFLQPINDTAYSPGQSLSVFKAGSTVPVKFQIKNASGVPVQALVAPLWLAPQKGSSMSASIDESTYFDTGTSGTNYRWDSASQQYIYNWNTKGLAAGYWYKVFAQLEDGKIYSVVIGLK